MSPTCAMPLAPPPLNTSPTVCACNVVQRRMMVRRVYNFFILSGWLSLGGRWVRDVANVQKNCESSYCGYCKMCVADAGEEGCEAYKCIILTCQSGRVGVFTPY